MDHDVDIGDAVCELPATFVEVVIEPDRGVGTSHVDRTCETEGIVL